MVLKKKKNSLIICSQLGCVQVSMSRRGEERTPSELMGWLGAACEGRGEEAG